MGNPIAEAMCDAKYIEDIAAADAWGYEMGLSEDEVPSTILGWFGAINYDNLKERAKTIRQLSEAGSAFEYLFNDQSFTDLKDTWTTGDAEAFLSYCGDGTSTGLWGYLLALKDTATAHVGAIDDYIDSLEALVADVYNAFSEHIVGFGGKTAWNDIKVLFHFWDPYALLSDFTEAVMTTAEQFGAEVTSLSTYESLMTSSWVPTVGGTPYEGDSRGPDSDDEIDWDDHTYGATDSYPLDGEGERSAEEVTGEG